MISVKPFDSAKKTTHRPGLSSARKSVVFTVPISHFRKRKPVIFVIVPDLFAEKTEAVLHSILHFSLTIFR